MCAAEPNFSVLDEILEHYRLNAPLVLVIIIDQESDVLQLDHFQGILKAQVHV